MYRVVVIDDEAIVVKGIEAILKKERLECQIVGAGNTAQEGLRILEERKPDLVFTDIRMPGMDGLELIEKARKILPGALFVVISGYCDFEYARKALQLGVVDYIEKPITIEKLRELFVRLEEKASAVLPKSTKTETDTGNSGKHHAIERMLAYIDLHFNEDIGLGHVAEELEMSQGYLSALFKEEMGISFVKYLTKLRIEKAKVLLEEGHKVSDVSTMVGYTEYRYFSEVFKKQVGQTPNEYRGHIRNKNTGEL